jgi:hypothetical protein
MEPEVSIPYSQEPSTGPYPEPYQSNPHHPNSLSMRRDMCTEFCSETLKGSEYFEDVDGRIILKWTLTR